MNWITTNIRFPEEEYIELKMEAAKKRKSVASIIRERVFVKKTQKKKSEKLALELAEIQKAMMKENKGLNLTKALIEMRYEQ